MTQVLPVELFIKALPTTAAKGVEIPAGSTVAVTGDGGGVPNGVFRSLTPDTDLVVDASPQLGANLDVNGNSITSANNGHVEIAPNGTGDVRLTTDTVRVGDSNTNTVVTTNGTGDLTLNTNGGTNSGSISIADGTNGNISVTPNGTGSVVLDGLSYPQADGTNGQYLQTDGSGNLSFSTVPISGSTFNLGDWTLSVVNNELVFSYTTGGTTTAVAKIGTNGQITSANDVTAFWDYIIMPIADSGPINMSDIRTVFGGSSPDGLSEYYKGGSIVPENATTANVPADGSGNPISFSNFKFQAEPLTGMFILKCGMTPEIQIIFWNWTSGFRFCYSNTISYSGYTSNNVRYYQPVFRAGTGFITTYTFAIGQNEDVSALYDNVVLYGGTNSSNVTTEVFKWRCLFHGSLGNSHSYRIDWNANGSINQIQHLGVSYANNGTKIVLYYENINSDHRWYRFFCKVPRKHWEARKHDYC